MTNDELAAALSQYADLAEIKGENAFRVTAFRRAAEIVEHLDQPIEQLIAAGAVTEVPGIGPSIATALAELNTTGHFAALDALLDEVPGTLLTLLDIPGVGPKTAGRLYRELGITDLAQLRSAASAGQLRTLKGFGAKQEQRILQGIDFLSTRTNRVSIGLALPIAELLAARLSNELAAPVAIAGSVRRMRETVGNIDLVVAASDPGDLRSALEAVPGLRQVEVDGRLLSATADHGLPIRVFAADPATFGRALVEWTGSAEYVNWLRMTAGGTLPPRADERDVFAALDQPWLTPERREAPGETAVPGLVTVADLAGDLHVHSDWSDGHGTILELARAARERGYQYLSISDHSGSLGIARGLDADRLRRQWEVIDRVNQEIPEVRLLRSSEVEVRRDGSLDFPDEILAQLDIVVASLHSGLSQPIAQQTERILRVIENPNVDIVAHPTGRIIERRPGTTYDWEQVFRRAAETGTVLEINANPARLDLADYLAAQAIEAGVVLAINTDAHDLGSLDLMRFGIGVARRAGVTAPSVMNTRDLSGLLAWLRR